jgi:Alanine racemase
MGRMGVPEPDAVAVFKRISALPNIKIHSISTHLPVSNEDAEYTRDELLRFGRDVKQLRAEVPGDYKVHVLQSAGVLAFHGEIFDIVRAGIVLYGVSPLPEFQKLLKPVMTWKNENCSPARYAEGQFHQLWPDVHHSAKDADRDIVGWLRRWVSATSFQS